VWCGFDVLVEVWWPVVPEGAELVELGVEGVVVAGFGAVFATFAGWDGVVGGGVAVAGGTGAGAGVVLVVAGGGGVAVATASGTAGFFDSARPGSATLFAPPAVKP
jgi:hypothetical protein